MRDELRAAYEERLPILHELAANLERETRRQLDGMPHIDRISFRAKEVESFLDKVLERRIDPPYEEPLIEVEDQVGGRILVFFVSDVAPAREQAERLFTPVEAVLRRPESYNVFDYESFHAIYGIPPPIKPADWGERDDLPRRSSCRSELSFSTRTPSRSTTSPTSRRHRRAKTSAASWRGLRRAAGVPTRPSSASAWSLPKRVTPSQRLLEGTSFVGGADVVAVLAQCGGDPARGDVRVEEEPHRALIGAERVDGGVLAPQLLERAAVVGDRVVDLLWERLVVREREADVRFGEIGRVRGALRRVEAARRRDDLPHVQRRADHPRPAVPIRPSKRDPREPPGAQRLLSEGLDHGSLAAARALGLERHQLIGDPGQAHAERLRLGRHEATVSQ